MGDFETAVRNAITAMGQGVEIDDATARVIVSLYHAGQASASYSFASTGNISDPTDVYRECFPGDYNSLTWDEQAVANMLGTYLVNRADRGPVAGWSKLWV
jgi:hypothetical protein